MIDNNIEDEANEREIRRIGRRELSKRLPFHCGQLMRYDEIENGDVLDRRRLTGTYYCEQCCTMQPTYEDVTAHDDDAPAAPERGDALESQEFYELMQAYRHASITDQNQTVAAFEAIKTYIREQYSTLIAQRERLLAALKLVTASYIRSDDNGIAAQKAREAITTSEQEGRR